MNHQELESAKSTSSVSLTEATELKQRITPSPDAVASKALTDDDDEPQSANTSPLSDGRYDDDEEDGASGLSLLDWIRMLSGLAFLISFISYVTTGTYFFFGYNGKYTKPSYIMHLVTPSITLTENELSEFSGKDPSKPIYISINGTIWDVTYGASNYGPKGAYHAFAGKEISRALATNCMNHLSYDLRDLEPQELRRLNGWQEFFDYKYWSVGNLEMDELKGIPQSRKECRGRFIHN